MGICPPSKRLKSCASIYLNKQALNYVASLGRAKKKCPKKNFGILGLSNRKATRLGRVILNVPRWRRVSQSVYPEIAKESTEMMIPIMLIMVATSITEYPYVNLEMWKVALLLR